MRIPAGMSIRLELVGGADGVDVVVQAVARAGAAEKVRELSRTRSADPIDACRVARDWLTGRIVTDAETHAPATPPVIEVETEDPSAQAETPF